MLFSPLLSSFFVIVFFEVYISIIFSIIFSCIVCLSWRSTTSPSSPRRTIFALAAVTRRFRMLEGQRGLNFTVYATVSVLGNRRFFHRTSIYLGAGPCRRWNWGNNSSRTRVESNTSAACRMDLMAPYGNRCLCTTILLQVSLWDIRSGLCIQTFYGSANFQNYQMTFVDGPPFTDALNFNIENTNFC